MLPPQARIDAGVAPIREDYLRAKPEPAPEPTPVPAEDKREENGEPKRKKHKRGQNKTADRKDNQLHVQGGVCVSGTLMR